MKPTADTVPAQETSRASEKMHLLARICVLKARISALKKLAETETRRLETMMQEDGDARVVVEWGNANFGSQRSFEVKDEDRLRELIPLDELLRHVRVNADLVDGAKKAKIPILEAVSVRHTPRFTVERAKTREAKEFIKQVIEETQQKAAARADEVARRLLRAKGE